MSENKVKKKSNLLINPTAWETWRTLAITKNKGYRYLFCCDSQSTYMYYLHKNMHSMITLTYHVFIVNDPKFKWLAHSKRCTAIIQHSNIKQLFAIMHSSGSCKQQSTIGRSKKTAGNKIKPSALRFSCPCFYYDPHQRGTSCVSFHLSVHNRSGDPRIIVGDVWE